MFALLDNAICTKIPDTETLTMLLSVLLPLVSSKNVLDSLLGFVRITKIVHHQFLTKNMCVAAKQKKKTRSPENDWKTFGPHSLTCCRQLLAQAQAAHKEGINLLTPDLSDCKTFATENPAVAKQIIKGHPGPNDNK